MINTEQKKEDRRITLGEEIVNSISNGLLIPIGILVFIFMIIKLSKLPSDYIYIYNNKYLIIMLGIVIIILYLMMTVYNYLSFVRTKSFFTELDHTSVCLLMLGMFTPILVLCYAFKNFLWLRFTKGQIFLLFQIILTFIGILLKVIWVSKWKSIHLILFLALGWSYLIILPHLWVDDHISWMVLLFLFVGGVSYSLGVMFYMFDNKKYYHFLWHLFVSAGTILHAFAIYQFIDTLY